MAEKVILEFKKYPEETKSKLRVLLQETELARKELDIIDDLIRGTNATNSQTLKELARKATGYGNYLRKKLKVIEAACVNEKGNRYMEIKLECSSKGITFADNTAKQEAETYIEPLRKVRAILEGYVIGAENVATTCKMCLYNNNIEESNVVLEE